jgi:hypothetical protein
MSGVQIAPMYQTVNFTREKQPLYAQKSPEKPAFHAVFWRFWFNTTASERD